MTDDTKIAKARQIAGEISGIKGILNCIVDDWDDYGGFRLFAKLNFKRLAEGFFPQGEVNLRKINFAIQRALKTHGASLNYIDFPIRRYECSCGKASFVGYDDCCVGIDFQV